MESYDSKKPARRDIDKCKALIGLDLTVIEENVAASIVLKDNPPYRRYTGRVIKTTKAEL